MATDEEDLRLNTLHRFQKHSPRLTLQVHSHCEVPAGCVGVVLRWVDPRAGFGAILELAPGDGAEAWIDGELVPTTNLTLAYGEHLLALRMRPISVGVSTKRLRLLGRGTSQARPFVCSVASDDPGHPRTAPATATSTSGWRATTDASGDRWRLPEFDDRSWPVLGASPTAADQLDGAEAYRFQRICRDHGAVLLELPASPVVFVRHRFQVVRR